ncbi:MAG: RING finger protein [Ignavibacteria bacterium]
MDESVYKISKSTCTFCQTHIKNESETFYCPSCSSPYHKDCWLENKGCAVYGCGEKVREDDEFLSIRETIINIEYLINRNQYSEAIYESKQLLKIDRRNPELKNLYNKAVALINNKINLMTSGDDAFNKKDFKAAEVYYKNVLKYTDDVETNFVNTRLEISKEKIPEQNRRRIYQNILIIILIIAIISAIGYLGYYTFVLKEDRDFSELVSQDNAADVDAMEKMIGKYENFLRSYSSGKNKNKALGRINEYSYKIANGVYKDDWKLALKYYGKIYTSIDSQDAKVLFNNVYNTAYKDYREKVANAKKFNSLSKFSESLNELNNAKLIVSTFPNTEFSKESSLLESNIALLNKKISSIVKYNDIEREIREQGKALSGISSSGSRNTLIISAKVNKRIGQDTYICKVLGAGNTIAIKSYVNAYQPGDLISLECVPKGKITVPESKEGEKLVDLYSEVDENEDNDLNISSSEKDAINERLKNLRVQKTKIDSLFKINLL